MKDKTDSNRQLFTRARTKYNYAKKKAMNQYRINQGKILESMSKGKPRQFWKSIKKYYKQKSTSNTNISIDSLFQHFNELLNVNEEAENVDIPSDIEDNDLDEILTEEEIKIAVLKQKNNKAHGPDEISAELIKSSIDIILPYVTLIFNKLFNQSRYPDQWGLGYIAPIYKGGDETDAKNYRGITLNNILAKIYSQVLLNRLNKWSIKHETISNCQFGFQKGKSTTDCIFILHSIIKQVLNSGKKLYCAFIDYEKCFDRINRTLLWQKLINQNVSSKFINAIKAMYTSVRASVKHNGEISEQIPSLTGVKQGDPSSSLLFMLFVNDIAQNINTDIGDIFTINEMKIFLIAYADDQVLFSTSPESLQSMISDLQIYCETYKLKINTNKTKIMIFESCSRPTTHNFYLYNEKLEVVSSFKYLGMHLFRNGNWNRTQKHIAEHASKSLCRLFSVFRQYNFKTSEKSKLFDTLVASILNYCSEIWGWHDGKDVELIHTKFCRRILGVNKSTNLDGLYGELARVPLKITRKINMIKYWLKIIKLDENSYIKNIYNNLKDDADNNITYNKENWAYHIKSILNELGFSNIWVHQENANISLDTIKTRILDQYKQTWYAHINNSQRLLLYARYKHSFELEKYLDTIYDRKLQIALSRFRLSSHQLMIERGRYTNIPKEERICKFCNSQAIENEYHFLMTCDLYKDLRNKYFKQYYRRWPTLNKFDKLMSSSNKTEILKLSKYVYFATKLRKTRETELS